MKSIVIIGGGAAGFFGAIRIKEKNPELNVVILEKTAQPLAKVRISGGGRCNVTHSCFEIPKLVQNYPRGTKELLSPFSKFQPRDMIQWLEKRGVLLKTEEDGRMFPVTDSSQTIIDCLYKAAEEAGVVLKTGMSVENIQQTANGFFLEIQNHPPMHAEAILVATGSNKKMYDILQTLNLTVDPLVPSLFTFNVPSSPLLELSGIALEKVRLKLLHLEETGPLLLTHWGFSGPAVLKLSSKGAKELFQCDYKTTFTISWVADHSFKELEEILERYKQHDGAKQIGLYCPFGLPKNLWKKFLELLQINEEKRFSALSKKEISVICEKLLNDRYQIDGKTTYKNEFVTCGGINLKQVDFKTMQSKVVPHLYFAGEVLNIDGITGGFNFQNAWTTSWIAAEAIVENLSS